MPHVAVLFEFPTLNGGERSMLAVLQALTLDHSFRFSAIAPQEGDLAHALSRLSIPVYPLAMREHGRKLPESILHEQLLRIVRRISPDILHSNSLSMSRTAGQIKFIGPSGFRRTGHLRDIIRLNAKVVSDLNANDALIAVSEATRIFHVSQGLDSERCTVIHNGVDSNTFRPRDKRSIRLQLFPEVPASAKLLLNVGQICLRKGQHHLAKTVSTLLKTRDDVHLLIAGERHSTKSESIACEAAIHEEFAATGHSSQLHMAGYRDDVHLIMNAADVLVHTARQEPFGRTLLEAASSGLPIIATNVGGTSEMLRHNQDAMLVQPDDQTALTSTLVELLNDESRRQKLAKSARERIRQEFTAQRMATRMSEFWKSV